MILDEILMALRYARDLRGVLRQSMSLDDAHRLLKHSLATRPEAFLRMMEGSIFARPGSPYLVLLQAAGITLSQIQDWVAAGGVESALEQLYAAGVYISLDEFKGRKPIQRLGLNFKPTYKDFDNPGITAHVQGRTGGSTSAGGSDLKFDLNMHTQETAHDLMFLDAFDLLKRPQILWRPGPPGPAGLGIATRRAKIGYPPARWFSQTPIRLGGYDTKYQLFLRLAINSSRLYGRPIPLPEYLPLENAVVIARLLADFKTRGTPGMLETNVGSGIRVCLAAREAGLDISGTFLRLGSEPFTEARAKIVAEAGCPVAIHYFMSEVSRVGSACAAPAAVDDVHLLLDKLAFIQKDRVLTNGETVGAIYMTTLHPSTAKLMLNVETGDYGTMIQRECGCPLGQIGLHLHLHSVRSSDKLTSDGMNFLSSELLSLVEDVLPARFGGAPTDYQIVETDEGGLAKVLLLASPRLGPLNETELVDTALKALAAFGSGERMMADYWRRGGTLRVLRQDPLVTAESKIPALYRAPESALVKERNV